MVDEKVSQCSTTASLSFVTCLTCYTAALRYDAHTYQNGQDWGLNSGSPPASPVQQSLSNSSVISEDKDRDILFSPVFRFLITPFQKTEISCLYVSVSVQQIRHSSRYLKQKKLSIENCSRKCIQSRFKISRGAHRCCRPRRAHQIEMYAPQENCQR